MRIRGPEPNELDTAALDKQFEHSNTMARNRNAILNGSSGFGSLGAGLNYMNRNRRRFAKSPHLIRKSFELSARICKTNLRVGRLFTHSRTAAHTLFSGSELAKHLNWIATEREHWPGQWCIKRLGSALGLSVPARLTQARSEGIGLRNRKASSVDVWVLASNEPADEIYGLGFPSSSFSY